MKYFAKRPKDERVQAEINNIYRIAYFVLSFGIAFDLVLQITDLSFSIAAGGAASPVRPVEFLVFIAANILSLILMVRKGFGDDNSRYAEMDRFPHSHYLGLSVLAALGGALICGGIMVYQQYGQTSASSLALIVSVLCGSVFLSIFLMMYAALYLWFRVAKRRRAKIERELESEEH